MPDAYFINFLGGQNLKDAQRVRLRTRGVGESVRDLSPARHQGEQIPENLLSKNSFCCHRLLIISKPPALLHIMYHVKTR